MTEDEAREKLRALKETSTWDSMVETFGVSLSALSKFIRDNSSPKKATLAKIVKKLEKLEGLPEAVEAAGVVKPVKKRSVIESASAPLLTEAMEIKLISRLLELNEAGKQRALASSPGAHLNGARK